jgi:large subunit ribosomal protein L15
MHATLAQALYAIVGAISLQKGGDMANRIARERIVARLMTS